ncbi:hypothetical protein BEWA_049920 [Theileria equi strain WA]|uniref:Uncharacterized protein n=1 Tax=Theileria equi strain WA TaxID=1537102 RepID=L1LB77_THEEQ|nr:hypothetical protein BEWA_049920 [Theileria equi strain WA]EKX72524.1 hypothetical protein BEWA_049920 [Theileria equi strain WA]|eukprot:XP_004831976.1 hypothetical protein BEWA_049920 [Theileria equi strain WA]
MTHIPTVTIDIQGNTNGGGQGAGSITYYGGSPNQVKLTKIEDPASSGFVKLTHGPPSENSFTVAQVMFGGTQVSDIGASTGDIIQHLEVWYWYGDQDLEQPLLAEVLKENKYTYTSNKGGGTKRADYYKHTISSNYKLAKIKYDITGGRGIRKRIKSSELAFPVTGSVSVYVLYCGNNPALIYVKGTGQSKWYKKPNDSSTTASGDERWEEVPGLSSIILSDLNNTTIECNQWTALREVLNKLPRCNITGTCKEPPKPTPPSHPVLGAAGPLGPRGPDGGAGSDVGEPGEDDAADGRDGEAIVDSKVEGPGDSNHVDEAGGAEGPNVSGPESAESSPPQDAVPGPASLSSSVATSAQAAKFGAGGLATGLVMSWGSISGISSGTLAGSAATFFGGWKLYNRYKGDPWVRQVYIL